MITEISDDHRKGKPEAFILLRKDMPFGRTQAPPGHTGTLGP